MITFKNGHTIDFCCASGALGFTGNGYWWEQLFRWARMLRPEEFTIITKTLTFEPEQGNLRWYAPWRCVRLLPNGGAVNAVGLTNMGYKAWDKRYYLPVWKHDYRIIISICPFTVEEAKKMIEFFNLRTYSNIVAIEVNLSCPNTEHKFDPVEIIETVKNYSIHPIIAKMAYKDLHLCKFLDDYIDTYDLINTIPFPDIYPHERSPLHKYGLVGGVSGGPIRYAARKAIEIVKQMGCTKPIISGGGIDSYSEVLIRQSLGAEAYTFGTLFLRHPTVPNKIIKLCRQTCRDGAYF